MRTPARSPPALTALASSPLASPVSPSSAPSPAPAAVVSDENNANVSPFPSPAAVVIRDSHVALAPTSVDREAPAPAVPAPTDAPTAVGAVTQADVYAFGEGGGPPAGEGDGLPAVQAEVSASFFFVGRISLDIINCVCTFCARLCV